MFVIVAKTDEQDSLIIGSQVVASKGKLGVFLVSDWDTSQEIAACIVKFLGCESIEEVMEGVEVGKYQVVSELTVL
jgi:hypothetical protein